MRVNLGTRDLSYVAREEGYLGLVVPDVCATRTRGRPAEGEDHPACKEPAISEQHSDMQL